MRGAGLLGWAALLGTVSGLACVATRLSLRLLQWCFTGESGLLPMAAEALPPWRRALVPVAGALCAWTVLVVARRWHGPTTDYVKAVRAEDGRMPFPPTLVQTLGSAFSLATGAAVGREGAMIQFAAASTSAIARSRLQGFSRGCQVACGAAAAVASLYQAPVAGALFGLEVVLGGAAPGEFALLGIASGCGWLVGRVCLGGGPLFAVAAADASIFPAGWSWLWLLLLAVSAGLAGPAYQAGVRSLQAARRLPAALLWGGCTVGLLSLVEPRVWGNGDQALMELMRPHGTAAPTAAAIAGLLVLRLLATSVCVGVGTIGGVFTPTLFAGAAAGLLVAHGVHAGTPVVSAIVAMGALLAAVTHAPWMATGMAIELTGRWELMPVLLVMNLAARQVARRVSPETLYGIATTRPGGRAVRSIDP